MREYNTSIFCDGCGKYIGKEERPVFNLYRVKEWRIFDPKRGLSDYDFCRSCSKKVEKAMTDICKDGKLEKTNED